MLFSSFNLPFNAQCFLLPILTGTLPVFDEICKRSSRFINSCLRSRYDVVRSIALHVVNFHGKYYSPLGRNLRFCCRRFGWQLEDLCYVLPRLMMIAFIILV